MRICIDLDGTICENRKKDQSYANVVPKKDAVKTIKKLKKKGHKIIIFTSRHMKTCNNNLGEIIAKQGLNLFNWLNNYEIPYDEIWFGKPLADIYIDDKAKKFTNWGDINKNILEKKRK